MLLFMREKKQKFRSNLERDFFLSLKKYMPFYRRVVVNKQLLKDRKFESDIYFPGFNLAVEIDGHPSHSTDKGIAYDNHRDRLILINSGCHSLRIHSDEISTENKRKQVIEEINQVLDSVHKINIWFWIVVLYSTDLLINFLGKIK